MKKKNSDNSAIQVSAAAVEVRPPPKKHVTLFAKIKRRIAITRIVFNVLAMLFYTVFVVVMLMQSWGNTVYISIILGFLALYMLLFGVILLITRKSHKHLSRSMKDYRSGLTILKSLLTIISFGLTVSIFAGAATSNIESNVFQNAVLAISLVWAVFQTIYQVTRILKRHEIIKKNKREKAKR